MIQFLATIIISTIVAALTIVNVPMRYFSSPSQSKLGSTVTTINSTDVISNFPTVYNANLNALNSDKLESGNSASLLTISSSTIGFLRVGYITATSTDTSTFGGALTVSGTGTSTYTGGLSMTGLSLTKGLNIAAGFGALTSLSTATSSLANGLSITKGCFELPSGSCLLAFDSSATYIFSTAATTTFTATTSAAYGNFTNGITGLVTRLLSTSTSGNSFATASTTISSFYIPPNVLYANNTPGVIDIEIPITNISLEQPGTFYLEFKQGSNILRTIDTFPIFAGQASNPPILTGNVKWSIYGNGATNAQFNNISFAVASSSATGASFGTPILIATTSAFLSTYDSTNAQYMTVTIRTTGGGGATGANRAILYR